MTDIAKHYFVYEIATGRILKYGQCTDGLQELQVEDSKTQTWMEGIVNDATQFLFEGVVTERPTIPVAGGYELMVGTGELTIGVPATTVVRITDAANVVVEYVVDDGSFTFSSDETGTFDIDLQPPFPWVPVQTRVTVI